MVKHYASLAISAIIEGLLFAIQSRTGHDISPSGIALTITNILEPTIPNDFQNLIPVFKILLLILPLMFTGVSIYRVGWKIGLIIFIPFLVGSYFLFISIG